jgi:hypothetical protein
MLRMQERTFPESKQLSPQVEQLLEAEQEKLHSNMAYFVTTGLLAFFLLLTHW